MILLIAELDKLMLESSGCERNSSLSTKPDKGLSESILAAETKDRLSPKSITKISGWLFLIAFTLIKLVPVCGKAQM